MKHFVKIIIRILVVALLESVAIYGFYGVEMDFLGKACLFMLILVYLTFLCSFTNFK